MLVKKDIRFGLIWRTIKADSFSILTRIKIKEKVLTFYEIENTAGWKLGITTL